MNVVENKKKKDHQKFWNQKQQKVVEAQGLKPRSCPKELKTRKMKVYWQQRYFLFSEYERGINLDFGKCKIL
jgi:hypothetical protein